MDVLWTCYPPLELLKLFSASTRRTNTPTDQNQTLFATAYFKQLYFTGYGAFRGVTVRILHVSTVYVRLLQSLQSYRAALNIIRDIRVKVRRKTSKIGKPRLY